MQRQIGALSFVEKIFTSEVTIFKILQSLKQSSYYFIYFSRKERKQKQEDAHSSSLQTL